MIYFHYFNLPERCHSAVVFTSMKRLKVHPDELPEDLDGEVSEVLDLHLARPGLEGANADPILEVVTKLVRHPHTEPTHCSRV